MMQDGCAKRRGADHGEALGASIKEGIHRRTLRRRLAVEKTVHVKRDAEGKEIARWTQRPLAVSRIMQVWRDMIVQQQLLRDEASTPYLQRRHFVQARTGYATVHSAAAASRGDGTRPSILAAIQEAREHE